MDLLEILKEYANAEPNRARGGLVALAGFDFQLRSYLADFVEVLARKEGLNPAGERLVSQLETLSDYLRSNAGRTVVVQAKRTLTRAVLSQTAIEFARLDLFLDRQTATGGPTFRPVFELVARNSKLTVDSAFAWPELSITGTPENDQLAQRFRLLVEQGRVRQPRIERDPWWRLIATAYSLVDDPFAFAREALDICLGISDVPGAGAEVHTRVTELFVRRRQSALRLPGSILRPEDVAEQPETTEVLVGQTASLNHLRDGRFADRPDQLAASLDALDQLVSSLGTATQETLGVFWIEGRSGSGKSVLLLQLLRNLVEHRGWPTIWLNRANQLVPLIARWPNLAQSLDFPVIVAIDDLYDRQNRQDLDLRGLSETLRENQPAIWPIILTCGPPEFHEALQRDSRGECLKLELWRLPPMNSEEERQIRIWYGNRTGHAPKVAEPRPPGWPAEPLMISLLFEMHHGDLRPFARRFAERLALAGLEDALRLPLALNRLYLWAPYSWLRDEEVDQLDYINADDDFRLFQSEEIDGQYLRLTHPHLSNELYQVLRPNPSARAFARDLAEAFGKALDTRPQLAWRLLQVFGEDVDRLNIVDKAELAHKIATIWQEQNAERRLPPKLRLLVFSSLAAWSAREPEVDRSFGTNLFSDALNILSEQSDSTPRRSFWESSEWAYVWQRLLDISQIKNQTNSNAKLVEIGTKWLTTREDRGEWAFVWRRLLEISLTQNSVDERTDLIEVGTKWLHKREDRSEWTYVWVRLLQVPEVLGEAARTELLNLGIRWLTSREDRSGWTRIWQRLLEFPAILNDVDIRGALLNAGKDWLAGREDRSDWNYVWQRLLQLPQKKDREKGEFHLLRIGKEWLYGRDERSEWNYIWLRLLESPQILNNSATRDLLLDIGQEWLNGREDHNGWPYVWKRLLEFPQVCNSRDICNLLLITGEKWLTGREDRSEWSHIWRRLLEFPQIVGNAEACNHLIDMGNEWLKEREDYSDWNYVWQRLLEFPQILANRQSCEHLLKVGRQWLKGREDRSNWNYVWRRLLEFPQITGNAETLRHLLDIGKKWLPKREDRSDWSHVWEQLLEFPQPPDDVMFRGKLLATGKEWLHNREDRRDWTHVWRRLLEAYRVISDPVACDALIQIGRQWLAGREARSNWIYVWQGVFRARDLGSFDVLEAGKQVIPWLESSSNQHHQAWQDCFHELLEAGVADDSLTSLGVAWCFAHSNRPQAIQLAVKILAYSGPSPSVVGLGSWLTERLEINQFLQGLTPDLSGLRLALALWPEHSQMEPWNQLTRLAAKFEKAAQVEESIEARRFDELSVGDVLRGIVVNITTFGAFIDLNGYTGLLHRRAIGAAKGTMERFFRIGQEIEVEVIELDPQNLRASLTVAASKYK